MRAKGMQDKMGSPRMIQVSRLWDNAWSWGISQGVYQSEWQTETDQQQSGNLPTPLLGSYLSSRIRPLGLIEAACEPSNNAGFGKSTDRSKSDPMAETSGPRLVMQCPCKPNKRCWNSWKCPFFGLADCCHIDCFPYRVTVSSDPLSKAATLSEWNWCREGGTR